MDTGLGEEECKDLILWYGTWIEKKRPYVILKGAITLDGRIASATGDSRWISSGESRAHVHEIRNRVDGLMVGSGTVMSDNPMLTCRMEGGRDPVRIILDPRLETDPSSMCLGAGSLIFTSSPRRRGTSMSRQGHGLSPCRRMKRGSCHGRRSSAVSGPWGSMPSWQKAEAACTRAC